MSMLTWSALLYAALTALCLSLSRHHRDVFGGRVPWPGPRALRWLGWMGMAGSLSGCLLSGPTGRSWVIWFCTFTALGYAINLGLAYAPRLMPLAGKAAMLVFVAGALLIQRH